MLTPENPIAVFDSGMGGVSVLHELFKLMPNERYLYFGDSKNAPYGTKQPQEILKLTSDAIEKLIDRGAKAVVIACNTATSAAARSLRKKHPSLPIIGLEPALKPAALAKENPTVIVMATDLTLAGEKFRELSAHFESKANIIKLSAPRIVELVEKGKHEGDEMKAYLNELFAPFDKSKIDCVVLGCTHYPFARKLISAVFDDKVLLFDGGEGAARNTKRQLDNLNLLRDENKTGEITFENSDQNSVEISKMLFNILIEGDRNV